NRVSFFSRFAKKKDTALETFDDESDMGDKRTEGMDADVFSQPIGFIPRFPSPPKYIKVRCHGKKEREFNRLFLAQELRGKTGLEFAQSGGRLAKNGGFKSGDPRKDGNAVWAMEFSKDGRYLAAGGQDYAVRVWAVIATAEDRAEHEKAEDAAEKGGHSVRLSAPVFKRRTIQEYGGHTASILDIAWSKNNFLLSSSMDKTVRLWHVSRNECLCCFKHNDFVTSIQFHPKDDRFFLAGSLDSKLRLWSIPDKSVAFWVQVPDLITSVAFSPDGKTSIAGCLNGLCLFYETEGLKYQTQVHVRSAHGKNAKGSKVTGIQAITYPPNDPNGDVKLLITSNDSRVRIYNFRDKGLEVKLKGNENTCSQIHASFSEDAKYVICGSEDRKAYIWSTGSPEVDKDRRPVEVFEAHPAIVTAAIIAPSKTRQLLSASGDPLYDLCNPPPVKLISRSESHSSSKPPSQLDHKLSDSSIPGTPATPELRRVSKPEESPAYIARSTHPGGNIIVTADYMGHIKVFRQDCAYQKRLRSNDTGFSKKMLGRSNSVATRNSRTSLSSNHHPSTDRINRWRQSIGSTNGSFENSQPHGRSISPRKSLGAGSLRSSSNNTYTLRQGNNSHPLTAATTPSLAATSPPTSPRRSDEEAKLSSSYNVVASTHQNSNSGTQFVAEQDPLMLKGDQSYMFWNRELYKSQAEAARAAHPLRSATNGGHSLDTDLDDHSALNSGGTSVEDFGSADDGNSIHHHRLEVPLQREITTASALSSEESLVKTDDAPGGGELKCTRCGEGSWKAMAGRGAVRMQCAKCGTPAPI
ncbi:MAG: hypothetical protein Q9191_006943, partial [Dirinaria sp. TL-2023a]